MEKGIRLSFINLLWPEEVEIGLPASRMIMGIGCTTWMVLKRLSLLISLSFTSPSNPASRWCILGVLIGALV